MDRAKFYPGWTATIPAVCRRWRDVALTSSRLWQYVDLDVDIEWAEAALARSKGTPIRMNFGLYNTMTPRYAELIKEHLPHTKAISFEHVQTQLDRVQGSYAALEAPAPLLETAILGLRYEHWENPVPLPRNLFGNTSPRLTRLTVEDFGFSWKYPVLSNLVSLKISLSDNLASPSPQPFLHHALDALDKMHSLEVLTIFRCIPVAARDIPLDPHRVVALPLKHLTLAGSLTSSITFFRSLQLPASTYIEMHMAILPSTSEEDLRGAVSLIGTQVKKSAGLSEPLLLRFSAQDEEHDYIGVDVRDDPAMRHGDDEKRLLTLSFTNLLRLDESSYLDVVSGVCEAYADHFVSSFQMALCSEETFEYWLDLLGPMKRMQKLTLQGDACTEICLAMSMYADAADKPTDWQPLDTTSNATADDGRTVFLQNVSSLEFLYADLDSELTLGMEELPLYQFLPRILDSRMACGAVALKSLVIRHAEVFINWADILRASIPRVILEAREADSDSSADFED